MKRMTLTVYICIMIVFFSSGLAEVRIALSMNDMSTARNIEIVRSIEDAAASDDECSLQICDAHGSLSEQKNDIIGLLDRPPDYLIISAVKSIGLKPVIAQTAMKGVKIIFIDNLSNDASKNDILTSIHCDEQWAAGECARILADYFGGENARILEIQGNKGEWSAYQKTKGFRDTLCEYENLQISGVICGTTDRYRVSKDLMDTVQLNNDRIAFDAIFCHSDEEGIGAVYAMLSLSEASAYEIPIVCIGGHSDVMKAVRAGLIHACIAEKPDYGELVMEVIRRDLAELQVEREYKLIGNVYMAGCEEIPEGY